MKTKLALLAAVAAIAAPAVMTASAQAPGFYASGGYANYHFDGADADLGGLQGRLGYSFTPNIAIEGEGTIGVVDDGPNELNNELGLYAVGKIPVSSQLDLFARVGMSRTEVNDNDDDGLAYGAGAPVEPHEPGRHPRRLDPSRLRRERVRRLLGVVRPQVLGQPSQEVLIKRAPLQRCGALSFVLR